MATDGGVSWRVERAGKKQKGFSHHTRPSTLHRFHLDFTLFHLTGKVFGMQNRSKVRPFTLQCDDPLHPDKRGDRYNLRQRNSLLKTHK